MDKINVMFSSRPKLLSDVIRNLINLQSDMHVTGEVIDPIELIFVLRETPVDVVIITPMKVNGEPRICLQLLKEHPFLHILVLTPESKGLFIYRLGIPRKSIENPTGQRILDAIRESRVHKDGNGKKINS